MGSSGSAGGSRPASTDSAAPTLRTPNPVSGSQPGRSDVARRQPDGLDDLVGLELRAGGANPGHRGRDHRCGEARAVERLVAVLAGGVERFGTAVRIPSPGALRSIASLTFENHALESSGVVAATVTTCGSDAGNSSGFPSANSLPAAATAMIPLATAK